MRFLKYILLFLTVSSPLLLAGCEDSVSPILESDRRFTLWGTLDMNRTEQYVRVIPIRPILNRTSRSEVNVDVKSIDLDTGETIQWEDSVVTFADGNIGHVFHAHLRIRPTHTYRIEVRSPDSELVTSAETTIPRLPSAEVFEEVVTKTISPIGFNITGIQELVWRDVNSLPYEIEQWYRFLKLGDLGFLDFRMPYVARNQFSESQHSLSFSLDLKRDRDTLDAHLSLSQLRLVGLGMTITILDEGFVPPGGKFDPEILVQPGTLSNVENGFGLIGSIGSFSIEWVIKDSSATTLGYVPLSGASSALSGPGKRIASLRDRPWSEER